MEKKTNATQKVDIVSGVDRKKPYLVFDRENEYIKRLAKKISQKLGYEYLKVFIFLYEVNKYYITLVLSLFRVINRSLFLYTYPAEYSILYNMDEGLKNRKDLSVIYELAIHTAFAKAAIVRRNNSVPKGDGRSPRAGGVVSHRPFNYDPEAYWRNDIVQEHTRIAEFCKEYLLQALTTNMPRPLEKTYLYYMEDYTQHIYKQMCELYTTVNTEYKKAGYMKIPKDIPYKFTRQKYKAKTEENDKDFHNRPVIKYC